MVVVGGGEALCVSLLYEKCNINKVLLIEHFTYKCSRKKII